MGLGNPKMGHRVSKWGWEVSIWAGGGFKIGFENAKMGLRVLWGSQNEAEEGI